MAVIDMADHDHKFLFLRSVLRKFIHQSIFYFVENYVSGRTTEYVNMMIAKYS